MSTIRRTDKKQRLLRPVHSSLGLECAYRKKLQCLIDEMNASVVYWLKAAFRANAPELTELASDASPAGPVIGVRSGELAAGPPFAQDAALPANALRRSVRKLARRWQKQFNEASTDLAQWFTFANRKRSTAALHSILKKGGWSVDFKMTPAQRDIFQATVHENVSLIKSIPQHYFTQVEGMVMRSVQSGRDLKQLTNDLQRNFRVTRRRATLIARDQNQKVSSAFTRAHQIELGIKTAIWVHSHAGKTPRPTHVAMDGKEYDVKKGMWDSAVKQWVFPGTLINCRCFARSVIPGFS